MNNFKVLKSMSREAIIELLCLNDPNGCYRDDECMLEFGQIMTKDDAILLAVEEGLIDDEISRQTESYRIK